MSINDQGRRAEIEPKEGQADEATNCAPIGAVTRAMDIPGHQACMQVITMQDLDAMLLS